MRKQLYLIFAGILSFGTFFVAQAATAEIAVIASLKGGCKKIDLEAAQNLFLAKTRSCDGQMMTLVEPDASSKVRREFLSKVIHKDASEYKAYWSVLIFTGRARPSRELNSDAEVKKMVAENEGAIGYIDAESVDSSVRVVLQVP